MYPERYGTSYGAAEAVGLPVPQWALWLRADAERRGEVSTPSNPSPTVGLGRSLRSARRWVEGATLRARPLEEKIAITREFATQLLPHVASGALAPVIDSRYPLDDVAAAHTRMGDNANAGKLVLDVQSS